MSAGVEMSVPTKFDRVRTLTDRAQRLSDDAGAYKTRSVEYREEADELQRRVDELRLRSESQGVVAVAKQEAADALQQLIIVVLNDVGDSIEDPSIVLAEAMDGEESLTPAVQLVEADAVVAPDDQSSVAVVIQPPPDEVVVGPVVQVAVMTDAELMKFGNDFPLPQLPLSHYEAAQIFAPYLNEIDGPRLTYDELERFCRSRRYKDSIESTHQCACCEEVFNSRDCHQVGSVVLCNRDTDAVLAILAKHRIGKTFWRDGRKQTRRVERAHYVFGAIRFLKTNQFDSPEQERWHCEYNLARETRILDEIRSGRRNEDDFRLSSSPQTSGGPQYVVAPGVVMVPADRSGDIPFANETLLSDAKTVVDFESILDPLYAFRKEMRHSLGTDALYDSSDVVRQINVEISRIAQVWQQRDPATHTHWKRLKKLVWLMSRPDPTAAQVAERIELETDKKLAADARIKTQGRYPSLSGGDEAAKKAADAGRSSRARAIRKKTRARRTQGEVAFLARFDADRRVHAAQVQDAKKRKDDGSVKPVEVT